VTHPIVGFEFYLLIVLGLARLAAMLFLLV